MELILSDEKTKELLTEIITEMIKQKREVFYEIILEAIEEAGLANAIAEGRKNSFVSSAKLGEDLLNKIDALSWEMGKKTFTSREELYDR